jgi:hypothetical protein
MGLYPTYQKPDFPFRHKLYRKNSLFVILEPLETVLPVGLYPGLGQSHIPGFQGVYNMIVFSQGIL